MGGTLASGYRLYSIFKIHMQIVISQSQKPESKPTQEKKCGQVKLKCQTKADWSNEQSASEWVSERSPKCILNESFFIQRKMQLL